MGKKTLIALMSVAAVTTGWIVWRGADSPFPSRDEDAMEPAIHVGAVACADCHERETGLWRRSHHDLAMQVATRESVLGDFGDATFTYAGITSTFFERDGGFFVRTDGRDGELTEFEIAYTFGVTPLQQYLIALPGGRYQALGLAWDSRPAALGGGRWFHLYPDEAIDHNDRLHWTRSDQTWNFMCAECHSTDLRKNYSPDADSYSTEWAEIDVACEACHGPGSKHVAWAASAEVGASRRAEDDLGLTVRLLRPGEWSFDDTAATARLVSPPPPRDPQVQTCAPCHSRRSTLEDGAGAGDLLLDNYRLSLLTEELYHADGQIDEEVYVYGSFVQSAMYRAGVECSDCHEPHSLRVRSPGNSLCVRCHRADRFDTAEHHHHPDESTGSECAACHMPETVYMVVDPRRDHSLRVPRPDLSPATGAPDACTGCHDDRSAGWAADAIAGWYGPSRRAEPHYGEAIHSGRVGAPGASDALAALADDASAPGIARATALSLLRDYPSRAGLRAIQLGLGDPDPLVRMGALEALFALPAEDRLALGFPALTDSVKAVRLAAARALAAAPASGMSAAQSTVLDRAVDEYIAAQLVNADRASAHLNLGVIHTERGQYANAESAYRTAIRLDPTFIASYVNLADLYRIAGRDGEAERALLTALEIDPDDATVHHTLGLLYSRTARDDEALASLKLAAELSPESARFSYVYGIALNSFGRSDDAIIALEAAHARHPNDPELLFALVTINRDDGALSAAIDYARKLVSVTGDPGAERLLRQLEAMER